MEFVHILLTSFGSIIILFILTKIIGNKQISSLNMFDYINSITIGSIAAEMATSLENDFLKPLIAMGVYALTVIVISLLSSKSMRMRRLFEGCTITLFNDGKLYKENFKRSRLDINEFLTQCRIMGYFNLSDIQTAMFEPNGKLSILPKSTVRPVNPNDMSLSPQVEKPIVNVIIDGKVMYDNLKYTGNDEIWLERQLKEQGVSDKSSVFLATCDCNNNLSIYMKLNDKARKDIFQ